MFVLAVGAALLLFLVIVGIGRWREAVAERKRLEAERALQEREEELLSDSALEYEHSTMENKRINTSVLSL